MESMNSELDDVKAERDALKRQVITLSLKLNTLQSIIAKLTTSLLNQKGIKIIPDKKEIIQLQKQVTNLEE
jgi:prefoldin subunit 5